MWIASYGPYGAPKRVSKFAPPPPVGPVTPVHKKLLVGSALHRVYDPTRFGATATGYRYDGPFARMDHHVTSGGDRGILYAARSYAASLIEVIDGPLLHIGRRRHVTLRVEADLCMLDLRGNGALGAGTDARIGKCPHDEAQPWARYFYEQATYGAVAGLLWFNSHNDDEAVAVFERAGSIFSVLTDVPLRSELVDIASLITPMRKTIDFSSI
jgi:hypothetical protein